MVKCWVQGCPSYSGDHLKTRFFRIPKRLTLDVARAWKQNLSRKNRKFNVNDTNLRICEKHFHPDAIIKNYTYIINGEQVHLPRGQWKLAANAVPTLDLPTIPKNYTWEVVGQDAYKGKKPGSRRAACTSKVRQRAAKCENVVRERVAEKRVWRLPKGQSVLKQEDDGSRSSDNHITLTIAVLEDAWLRENQKSSDWVFQVLHENGCPVAYFVSLVSESKAVISKQIRVFQTMEFQVFFMDTDVTTFFASSNRHLALQSMTDVWKLLESVSKKRLCLGLEGFSKITMCDSGHKVNHKWFSRSCDVVGVCKVCIPCKRLHMCLSKIECSSKASSEGQVRLSEPDN